MRKSVCGSIHTSLPVPGPNSPCLNWNKYSIFTQKGQWGTSAKQIKTNKNTENRHALPSVCRFFVKAAFLWSETREMENIMNNSKKSMTAFCTASAGCPPPSPSCRARGTTTCPIAVMRLVACDFLSVACETVKWRGGDSV